jgi:3D (Asp-Asp-Asp) domain-containing protein
VDVGSRRPWIRFAALGLLTLAALLSSSAARADDPSTLRTEAERLRAENDSLAARSQEALLDLYSLDTRLARAEARLIRLRAQRGSLEEAEAAARENLASLAVILAADSLDDALTAVDSLARLAQQDRAILDELRGARNQLRRSVRTLAQRSAELRRVVSETAAQQDVLTAARAERADYLANVEAQQALNSRQIDRLTAQAAAASARTAPEPERTGSASPAPASTPAPTPAPSPAGPKPGGEPVVVDVVAYCGGWGTASGLPLGWGTVAVDTSVFPFGTKMHIPGYGNGVAADRGTAIIGKIIDIWFPTCAQARAWGRKTLTITVYW